MSSWLCRRFDRLGVLASLVIIGGVSAGCKVRSDGSRVKIVNGKTLSASDYPSVVLISTIDPQNPNGASACTGTWVSDRTIITAAHCIDYQAPNPDQTSVRTGTGAGAKATRVHMFPGYIPHQAVAHDVAILEFPPNTSNVFTALASSQASPGDRLTIVGWGNFDHNTGTGAGTKRSGSNTVLSVDQFGRIVFEGMRSPAPGAEGTGENVTNSQGDSGGPMFINKRLAGTSSSVEKNPNDQGKLRGKYEGVRAPEVESWLKGLAGQGVYMVGFSKGTEGTETTDSTVLSGEGGGQNPNPNPTPIPDPNDHELKPTPNPTPDPTPGPTPDPTPDPTPGPAPTPAPTPSGTMDCNKDYSAIRKGGSGICKNSSSGFCYRYSGGDVNYGSGSVTCGSGGGQNSPDGGSGTQSTLDCNKDYTTIRAGGSGICLNRSSGFCYKYQSKNVQYGMGTVRCP